MMHVFHSRWLCPTSFSWDNTSRILRHGTCRLTAHSAFAAVGYPLFRSECYGRGTAGETNIKAEASMLPSINTTTFITGQTVVDSRVYQ